MTGALLTFGTAFGTGAAFVAIANWQGFFLHLSSRQPISFVPLIGGVLGTAATLSFWLADAPGWCLALALSTVLLDWGSGLGLLTAPAFYLRHKLRKS